MVFPKHLATLNRGVRVWNRWREKTNHRVVPDLNGADLAQRDLRHADFHAAEFEKANFREARLNKAILSLTYLREADLTKADLTKSVLSGAWLIEAHLSRAKLGGANLTDADLAGADVRYADLRDAILRRANLTDTDLRGARLNGADLTGAVLVRTRLENANVDGCRIYGISAWDLRRNEKTNENNLVITSEGQSTVTVDDLEVAQFIYLFLTSEKLRNVIAAIQSRGVLLIGRFTKERLEILHAIRDELRNRFKLLPIMFEFDPQAKKTTIETVLTLAHMSRFVIADLSDAKAVVQELTKITDSLRSVPIKLIIHESSAMPSMLDGLLMAESVLKPVYVYSTRKQLLKDISIAVVGPANDWATRFETRLTQLRREYLPWQTKKKATPRKRRERNSSRGADDK